jgi:exodeoxyribonuclease III
VKIVTWNCCRGDAAAKLDALAVLAPDVAIVQEWARPAAPGGRQCVWFGGNPLQGVAVVAANGFEVEAVTGAVAGAPSAFAAKVSGPTSFNLLAVWAQRAPTYARAVLDALEEHRSFLLEGPSVVAGDFNTSNVLAKTVRSSGHGDIVRLLDELGLASAYHYFFGEEHGGESRWTRYFQWNELKPFHIDYCFVPRAWLGRIRKVAVGSYADWAKESDHRRLVVDIAD